MEKVTDLKVKAIKSIYPFYKKLAGKGSRRIEIFKITGDMGETYKLIRMSEKKLHNGSGGILEEAISYLQAYSGSDAVPELVYGGEKEILVKWIEGTPLSLRDMDEAAFGNLGGFVGSSIREQTNIESRNVVEESLCKCDELISKGLLDVKLKRNIRDLLDGAAKPNVRITEGICFGDTALKNFVEDKKGKLHYIDILGIYRAPIGQKAVKQMNIIPKEFRKSFLSEYRRNSQLSNDEINIGFFQIVYLINRIHAKHNKRGILKKISGKKKAKESILNLRRFIDAGLRGVNLEKFFISN